ncbi:MAG: hypothetical protein ABR499_19225 [Gemmatimonadaceae bacterium]
MPLFTPGLWGRALPVGAVLGLVGVILNGLSGLLFVTAGVTVVAAIVLDVEGWARRRFQRPGAPSLPAFGFIAWGLLPTFFAVLSLGSGPVRRGELLLGAFVLAWWLVAILLIRGVLSAILPALALVAVPWSFGAAQTTRRVAFIIREGGMERADGYGSPALFLINWVMELSLLLAPLTLIAVSLGRALWRGTFRRGDLTLTALPRSSR